MPPRATSRTEERTVVLPAPAHEGKVSLERAFCLRRSERDFSSRALRLSELAQLLWAAQGLTDVEGRRTTPSALASYPLEVHAVVGDVASVPRGHYRYLPLRHGLLEVASGDLREALADAAHGQQWAARAPVLLVLSGAMGRVPSYGERARRYVDVEAGCAVQNLQLQAAAMGLSSVVVGSFEDAEVSRLLGLPGSELPILIVAMGWPAEMGGVSC